MSAGTPRGSVPDLKFKAIDTTQKIGHFYIQRKNEFTRTDSKIVMKQHARQNNLSQCKILLDISDPKFNLLKFIDIQKELRLFLMLKMIRRIGIGAAINYSGPLNEKTCILYYSHITRSEELVSSSRDVFQIVREHDVQFALSHIVTSIDYGIDMLIIAQLPENASERSQIYQILEEIKILLTSGHIEKLARLDERKTRMLEYMNVTGTYSNIPVLNNGKYFLDMFRQINEIINKPQLILPINYYLRSTRWLDAQYTAGSTWKLLRSDDYKRIELYLIGMRTLFRTIDLYLNEQKRSGSFGQHLDLLNSLDETCQCAKGGYASSIRALVTKIETHSRDLDDISFILKEFETREIITLRNFLLGIKANTSDCFLQNRSHIQRGQNLYSEENDILQNYNISTKEDHQQSKTYSHTPTSNMSYNAAVDTQPRRSYDKTNYQSSLPQTMIRENILPRRANHFDFSPRNIIHDTMPYSSNLSRQMFSHNELLGRPSPDSRDVHGISTNSMEQNDISEHQYKAYSITNNRISTQEPHLNASVRQALPFAPLVATSQKHQTDRRSPSLGVTHLPRDVKSASSPSFSSVQNYLKSSTPFSSTIHAAKISSQTLLASRDEPVSSSKVKISQTNVDESSSASRRPSVSNERIQTLPNHTSASLTKSQTGPLPCRQAADNKSSFTNIEYSSSAQVKPSSHVSTTRYSITPELRVTQKDSSYDLQTQVRPTLSNANDSFEQTELPTKSGHLHVPQSQTSSLISISPDPIPKQYQKSPMSTGSFATKHMFSNTVNSRMELPPVTVQDLGVAETSTLRNPLGDVASNKNQIVLHPDIHQSLEAVSSKTQKLINILLVGETGVGKSTFINAFANYLSFDTLQQAEVNTPILLIPVSFLLTVGDSFEERTVKFGNITDPTENEDFNHPGQSVTQHCKSYVFNLDEDYKLCIIDTPGFGDTRGSEQDDRNIQHILEYINNMTHIDAVCFLLKPNSSRLTITFRTCLSQLVSLLGPNVYNNLIFCFTNSRSTFYTPGDTAPLVKKMLQSLEVKNIPFNKQNTYCFDSESFRYLIALQNGITFEEIEKSEYEKSWVASTETANRLIAYIREKLAPSPLTTQWQSIKHAQLEICYMIRPILETMRNILRNVILHSQNSSNNSIEFDPNTIHRMVTLCLKCKRTTTIINQFSIVEDSPHECKDRCLQCSCAPNQHVPIYYLLRYKLGHCQSKEMINELQNQLPILLDASVIFGYFLVYIAISNKEDPFSAGLRRMISEEKYIYENEKSLMNNELLRHLQKLKQDYDRKFKEMEIQRNGTNLSTIYEWIQKISTVLMIKEQLNVINIGRKILMKQYERDPTQI